MLAYFKIFIIQSEIDMDYVKLIKKFSNCKCKMEHTCNINAIEIGEGALNKLPILCEDYNDILLVFDTNTYSICGQTVTELLKSKSGKMFLSKN